MRSRGHSRLRVPLERGNIGIKARKEERGRLFNIDIRWLKKR